VQRRRRGAGHVVPLVGPFAVDAQGRDAIRPQQHAEDLLARPQLDRLEDARRRQLDLLRVRVRVRVRVRARARARVGLRMQGGGSSACSAASPM